MTRDRTLALLPYVVMGAVLWLSHLAFRVAVADLIYPQQQVLQPSHWIYKLPQHEQQQRLKRALRWTPMNNWYWQTLGHLTAQSGRGTGPQLANPTGQQDDDTLQQAAAWYQRALQQTPTEPYTQLAFLAILQRLPPDLGAPYGLRTAQARAAHYAHIATLAPNDPRIQYRTGALLLAEDAHDETQARPFFRRAMQLDSAFYAKTLQTYHTYFSDLEAFIRFGHAIPQTPQGHHIAAQHLEEQSWVQARWHYLAALAHDKSNPRLLRAYAQALQRHQGVDAALTLWKQLRQKAPDDAAAYLSLADIQRDLGDQDGERQTLQQLVDRFPEHPDYLDRLASAYLRQGLTSQATDLWQTLLDRRPELASGYLGLADVHERQHNYPAAIEMMRRVLTLAPGTISYHRRLAQLYIKSGDRAKSLREYKRLAALRPDNPWAFYHLGEYFLQEEAYHRAITYYQRAQMLDAKQALYWRQMGVAHAARGDYPQAIQLYHQALLRDAADPYTHYYLGISYEANGDPEPARLSYAQAARLAPDNARFRQRLDRINCVRKSC